MNKIQIGQHITMVMECVRTLSMRKKSVDFNVKMFISVVFSYFFSFFF